MAKKRSKKPSGTLTVRDRSLSTGEVIEKEFDLSELSVAELRRKMKEIYGVDLSRADARRLQKMQTVNIRV